MNGSLKTLEFDKIKSYISNYTFTSIARDTILNLNPNIKLEVVNNELNKTNQLLSLIVKYGSLPFLENFDNNLLNNDSELERVYHIEELLYLKLYLIMESEIISYVREINENDNINSLKELFSINEHIKLTTLFKNTFTDYGEIFDDASKDLKSIRTIIKKLQFDLENKMQKFIKSNQEYLTDPVVVTRNGRYCVPVKETYKNKIKGVVHDISQSKQTIFIEPEISLQIMAEIEMNKLIELKEIERILINITTLVNLNLETLKSNFNKLIKLDVIHAKAKYSLKINGVKPNTNNKGIINFINAKHPLLDQSTAVPISLSLNNNDNILLITGPNTGGKTVALKTIGLLTTMVQSGILIPIKEDSDVAIFNNIFADIGDEQSIANSLSTFSSHIAHIIHFIDFLTDNTLILLDELGSGTDPNEGVALAIAIIEELNKKDVRLVVTSHYSELKTYAYEKEGIMTASVAFNKDTLQPMYYLQHGINGESHARLIASRLGMKKDVIAKANEIYSNKETDLAKIISKMNLEKSKLENERIITEKLQDKFIRERNELEKIKNKLIEEQTITLQKIRLQEEVKWKKKEEDINELIKVIELEKNVKEHQIAELKGEVNKKIKKENITDIDEILNVGDHVYIIDYNQYGHIMAIKGNQYRVVFGLFDLWFKKSNLKLVKSESVNKKTKEVTKKRKTNSHDVSTSGSLSLDLRGYRYEEVYDALDKAIDKALLSNLNTLTVIHGFGTGAVKEAVYAYLKKSNLISSYRYGGEGEGLNGATVITLK